MEKMRIISSGDSFPWRPIDIPEAALEGASTARNENWRADPAYDLFFLPGALRELHAFIGWGNFSYAPNRVEQIGFLAGRHYENAATGKRMCVVVHVLPVFDAKGSPTYIEYSADMMAEALRDLNKFNRDESDPCELLGWFHTHPNTLPTFMSGTDMGTQRNVFNSEHNYSVVLNPHTKSWKAFRGRDAIDSQCRWLKADALEELAQGGPLSKGEPQPKSETPIQPAQAAQPKSESAQKPAPKDAAQPKGASKKDAERKARQKSKQKAKALTRAEQKRKARREQAMLSAKRVRMKQARRKERRRTLELMATKKR